VLQLFDISSVTAAISATCLGLIVSILMFHSMRAFFTLSKFLQS